MRPLAVAAAIALGTGAVYFAGQSPSPVPVPTSLATTSATTAPVATPSPTPVRSTKPITGLLAQLVTEEVEPGVLRVVNDGYRDVSLGLYSAPVSWDSSRRSNVVAGQDGSVWLFGVDEWYRVGEPATYPVTDETPNGDGRMAQVTPDGTLWTLVESDGNVFALVSFEDGSWTVRHESLDWFDLEPDGTVWVSTRNGIGRLRDASRTPEYGNWETDAEQFWVSPVAPPAGSGDEVEVLVWGGCQDCPLVRWGLPEDGEPHGDVAVTLPAAILGVDMDGHGNVWLYQTLDVPGAGTWTGEGDPAMRTTHYLVHMPWESVVSGESVTVYTDDQGVPELRNDMRAAPDGSVWLTPTNESTGCGGLANFDGTTWTRYLSGRCVVAFDVTPDGTVWLQALPQGVTFRMEPDEADRTETLVIPG
jgi:hypothetical protein